MKTQTPSVFLYHITLNGTVSEVKRTSFSFTPIIDNSVPTPGTKLHYHTLISEAYHNSPSHKQCGN